MEVQMRQAYANIPKVLAEYKATMVSPILLDRRAILISIHKSPAAISQPE